MNIDELARAKGLSYHDYDTALPQGWVDDFYKKMDFYPAGHFVWSYKDAKIFGEPIPLTEEAEKLLKEYNGSSVL